MSLNYPHLSILSVWAREVSLIDGKPPCIPEEQKYIPNPYFKLDPFWNQVLILILINWLFFLHTDKW